MSCQFIPSYLLQHIVDNAPDDDPCTGHCHSTLLLDDQVRQRRRALAPVAKSAALAADDAGLPDDAQRTVYSAGNSDKLPGNSVRGTTDPPAGDPAVDEAWQSSGQIWDLFSDVFERKSVDGNGTALTITVHYGDNYDNAFWDGQQLVFGDGDGTIFDRFTKPMDVMAHEFTHGVTQHTAALSYQGQSGALNESVSDVFASICKQWVNGKSPAQADWLIGEGLFLPGIQGVALRSMKDPGSAYDDSRLGKDPQVGSMADYDDTTDDDGGVHINSGIPNRAFYLAATALGGHSWEKAGPIWYRTLVAGGIDADADFAAFATSTVQSAESLFADETDVAAAVRQAWTEVGVLGGTSSPTDSASSSTTADSAPTVGIRRSGGVTGVTRTADVDRESDSGRRISALLDRVDFAGFSAPAAQPDRFVYTVRYGESELTVGERDLSPDLAEAVRLAFANNRPTGGSPGN